MKLALVTGGTRRIGAAIADRLEADGWTVARHSHTPAPDGAGISFVADLADQNANEALLDAVTAHFGAAPSLLVNNASRFGDDDAQSATPQSIADYHAVNAAAPVQLAVSLARRGQGGAIINLLDQRIRNPNRDQLSYTLSKGALASATRTLAVSLAPHWRVNAVAPGLTLATDDYDAAAIERARAAMPLERLPVPTDIADAVAFLAASPAITGQTLFVDGGASLKSFERDFLFG